MSIWKKVCKFTWHLYLSLKSWLSAANVNSPKVVFYEAAHDEDGVKNHDTMSATLQKAVASLDPVATPEAAKNFAHLVHAIEQGSKADIVQAYSAAQGKTAK